MQRRLLLVASMAMVGVLNLAGPAQAATTAPQDFTLIVSGPTGLVNPPPGQVIARGPIAAVGSATQLSVAPGPNGTITGVNRYSFARGSVLVSFTGALTSFTFDPRTCVTHFTAAGTYTVAGESGAYAGATGSGTFTSDGYIFNDRTAQGCATTGREFTVVHDRGTITLP